MASSSKRPGKAAKKSILTPVMTLEGHEPHVYTSRHESKFISSISYLPDGKQMISGSLDKTIRRWDMREGKEIEEAREVCEYGISAVGVSRNGQWVVTVGGGKLKVCEVETGIVRTFYDGLDIVRSIDISEDSTLLASTLFKSGSQVAGGTTINSMRIWSLDTGELVADPFEYSNINGSPCPPALRFSENSKKLAVLLNAGCLQVWDVQTQKVDVTRGKSTHRYNWTAPVFWTTKDKSIVAAFSFTDDYSTMIYEFNASTLETVGDSFKGHEHIFGLALSFDCALLSSASYDTIKLWSFESRQLLASFDGHNPCAFILSPDSRQLAYTSFDDSNINICNIPPNILASTSKAERQRLADKLLNSDATRRRKPVILPVISPIPRPPRPPPIRNTLYPRFLRKLLPSSHPDAVHPIRNDGLRNPLDFPATAPLPRSHINLHKDSRPPSIPPTTQSWWPIRTGRASPPIVEVPLAQGKERNASADAPAKDDEWIAEEDCVSPPPSPNPDSQQPPAAGQINTGEHGSGRLCFCF